MYQAAGPVAPIDHASRQALRQAAAALNAAQSRCRPFEVSQALRTLARCYAAVDELPSTEASLQSALRWAAVVGSIDLTVDLLCELCETAARAAEQLAVDRPLDRGRARAARERARDHAFEAAALAGRVADPAWEVKVLLRISDVLDRCGERDEAMLLQTRALGLMSGRNSRADSALLPGLGRLADI